MNSETVGPAAPLPADPVRRKPGGAATLLVNRVLMVTAFLFVIVRALPLLTFPLGSDQGAYLMIGQGLLRGKHLYRDLMDTKPPGIFITYAGVAKLFGSVMWSAAAVDILLLLIISYLLFKFSERYLGCAGAALAVIVHASMHGEMGYFWIAQPETFQVATVLASYLFMMRRGRWSRASWFAAGLLLGYGCWLKPNAIVFLPVLLFLPFLEANSLEQNPPRISLTLAWRDWLAMAGSLLVGLGVAFAIVFGWVVFSGAWPAMREMQFEVVPRYAAMAVQRRPHYVLSAIVRTNLSLGVWNLWALLVALIVGWLRRDLRRAAPLCLAAVASFAAVAVQLRFHDYYFQTCYPFFAIIWAYLALSIFEGFRGLARKFRRQNWRLAAWLVWVVFGLAVYWPAPDEFTKLTMRYEALREWRRDQKAFYAGYPSQLPFEYFGDQLKVIDFLQKNAQPRDGLYIWGTRGVIYYLTDHIPPTRFHADLGLMSPWCPDSWRDELVRDLRRSQPRFIVVARHDAIPMITYVNMDSETFLKHFPALDTFVVQNYKPAADFENFVVYRRIAAGPMGE